MTQRKSKSTYPPDYVDCRIGSLEKKNNDSENFSPALRVIDHQKDIVTKYEE